MREGRSEWGGRRERGKESREEREGGWGERGMGKRLDLSAILQLGLGAVGLWAVSH